MSDPNAGLFKQPVSVELARALAEAVDGVTHFEKPDAFFVSRYKPVDTIGRGGFRVHGPFAGWEDVPQELKDCVDAGECGFFGPFIIEPDHSRGAPVDQIDLHALGGTTILQKGDVDALFFTIRAVEKFALPFYQGIFGPQFAQHVLDQFTAADVQVMAHFPWSEYSDGLRVPNVPVLMRVDESGTMTFVPLHGPAGSVQPPQSNS